MYKLDLTNKTKEALYQGLIGLYGSDKMPPNYYNFNWKCLIDLCAPCGARRRKKDGAFYFKTEARQTARTLEKYVFAGGMYLKAKDDNYMRRGLLAIVYRTD